MGQSGPHRLAPAVQKEYHSAFRPLAATATAADAAGGTGRLAPGARQPWEEAVRQQPI